jgi:hypothetical protein
MVDALRLPLCTVAYHHRTEGFRTVAKSIKAANGITAEKPGNRIIVSEIMGGVLSFPMSLIQNMLVYQRNETNELKLTQRIEFDFLPDNPCIISAEIANNSNHSKRRPPRYWCYKCDDSRRPQSRDIIPLKSCPHLSCSTGRYILREWEWTYVQANH